MLAGKEDGQAAVGTSPVGAHSPELALLLHAVRPAYAYADGKRLHELVGQKLDWKKLLSLSRRHRLTPLLKERLNAHAWDAVPTDIQQALERDTVVLSLRALFLANELVQVIDSEF